MASAGAIGEEWFYLRMGIALYDLEKPKGKQTPNNFQTALFWGGFFVHQFSLVRINVPDLILQIAAYYSINSTTVKTAR